MAPGAGSTRGKEQPVVEASGEGGRTCPGGRAPGEVGESCPGGGAPGEVGGIEVGLGGEVL